METDSRESQRRRQSMLFRTKFLIALALLMLSATAAFGQSTGSIVGTVTDPQGGVVADATVVARQVDTGIERTTKTTSDGLYRFDSLPPAIYNIRVQATGF